ncbi:MAG: hypothetical protein UV60_C0016G0011 [Parcubacteria group bacterium GW2011_GWA2_43_11]|nr:MAG: hypothetical protein UV60_C0016G0011 [Parcubacteria group bacterium GW2011_GWA2_43_11]
MNYRINTKVVTLVVLLGIVAVGLFFYTLVFSPTEISSPAPDQVQSGQTEERIMTARHQYLDGIHTIAGVTEVPTPCHKLVAETFFTETNSTGVEIRFNTLLEGEECPSQPFEVPFRVSFEADENAALSATWNGGPVRLNLIPLQSGEELDDVIYNKG